MKNLFLKDYEITEDGKVYSHKYGKKRLLKPDLCRGYHRYTFSENNKTKRYLIHRLVAFIFIPNPENKKCVNHKDGNKLNNHKNNLEWCTYSENENHSYKSLGKVNPQRKLKQYQIKDILNNCVKGKNKNNKGNVNFFMNKYQVSRKTILNVLNKKYYV